MCEKELFALCRKIRTERTTSSGVVSNTPALVFSLSLTSDGSGNATATIHDGSSTSAEAKLDLATPTKDSQHIAYWLPVFFTRGIYASHGNNVTSVVVRYMDIRE